MVRALLASMAAAAVVFVGSGAEAQTFPITGIAGKMGKVVGDLAEAETGEPVQATQREIVGDLDALIAELEKECAACRGGMRRNNPNSPAADSTIGQGTGGVGNLADPGPSEKDWAKLSSRERDRILQSMSEGFPPEYRTVLERYYRRLAEEATPGAETADGEQPETP
jgi:hypothetical protein